MESKNCYVYILVGLLLRFLRNIGSSTDKDTAKSTLDELKARLKDIDFAVSLMFTTSPIFNELEVSLTAIKEKTEQIGAPLAELITERIIELENIVFAEALTKKIFLLSPRRFNSDYLLNQPEMLLKKGYFDRLSRLAQSDITSSCKCILFGLSTASAFHILRATEEVLKSYYFIYQKTKRLKNPMWGPMVTQLKAKKTHRPPETLLNSLDMIRVSYRNPTQHPEAVYDIDTAQDLFGVCLDVIGKMSAEFKAP